MGVFGWLGFGAVNWALWIVLALVVYLLIVGQWPEQGRYL